MKVYLDFDGVILDTESAIDSEFDGNGTRSDFVRDYDWFKLMRDDLIINNSLNFIKDSKFDINLLSKISSMCEARAKVKYLRNCGINIDINFVPTLVNKSDVVCAKGKV